MKTNTQFDINMFKVVEKNKRWELYYNYDGYCFNYNWNPETLYWNNYILAKTLPALLKKIEREAVKIKVEMKGRKK